MKLASLKKGRDGELVVVSRSLDRAVCVPEIAGTLQQALDSIAQDGDYQIHGETQKRVPRGYDKDHER